MTPPMAAEQSMVERGTRVMHCAMLFGTGVSFCGFFVEGHWEMSIPAGFVAVLLTAALADVPAPSSQRDDAGVAD